MGIFLVTKGGAFMRHLVRESQGRYAYSNGGSKATKPASVSHLSVFAKSKGRR